MSRARLVLVLAVGVGAAIVANVVLLRIAGERSQPVGELTPRLELPTSSSAPVPATVADGRGRHDGDDEGRARREGSEDD